ncbi:xyloglucan O-acetyltransferase 2-like [Phragmites australis]|uniref:xyloglucan O-acetyltransferase 2-like n=1 Tax=Phragmites australis TaxID=29695 RepID=UPI002D797884|nr:xyloglucan O-acetyltransferase 2-like [Phragmites australis]
MGAYQPPDPSGKKPSSTNPGYFLSKPVCTWLACGFLSLALFHLLCCSPASTQQAVFSHLLQYINNTYSFVASVPEGGKSCNYSEGKWVWAPGHARRYNATECNVKESHDCIRNGRPDTGYLDWRWQPEGCPLPAFDARAFLSAVRGKHVALIGDSMARNQAQSLACLLSAAFPYRLVYRDPYPHQNNFWRLAFPTHDVTLSFYWSPFLVRATGKPVNDSIRYNYVHLDEPGDRWGADADTIDVVVLAAGHWLLNGAVYYNGSEVIGAHNAPELNHTGVGYAWPLRTVYRTAVKRVSSGAQPRTVVLVTFSPAHFEGNRVDSPTACTKMEPYKEGEKEMPWIFKEVRGIVHDEARAAKAANGDGGAVRIEVLDVTKLAAMRPDGHPGVYMNRDPFAHGVQDKMLSDCLHFCLPGPVDTFNEILLQLLRKRR